MVEGFERKTYTEIINDMESKAEEVFGDNIQLDTSSPLGMYIRAIAWELSVAWEEMEQSHFSHYTQYATGQDLDNIVNNFGRKRFLGKKAVAEITIEGEIDVVIPEGFKVSTANDLVFETTEEIRLRSVETKVTAQAVEPGPEYNVPSQTIVEVMNPITGINSVVNYESATGGTSVETDDNLRERHLQALREPATGDNVAQYKSWAREVEGVGNLKVLPTTPTAGFVTLILSDVNGSVANSEIVEAVERHIEAVRPVNAGVVVESASAKKISVTAAIRLATGYEVSDVKNEFEKNVKEHFRGIALKESYISFAQIGRLLLDTAGTTDYRTLLLNKKSESFELAYNEVPVLESIVFEVIE